MSDRDSVYAIINDYRNLIHTVKQSLPRTELLISSILSRPTDYQANLVIAEVNRQLFTLEEKQVKILDNTLDFLFGNRHSQSLFRDHVHTNTAGAKVLSDNILSSVYNMFGLSDRMSHYEQNVQSERITGRKFVPFRASADRKSLFYPKFPNIRPVITIRFLFLTKES